MEDNQLSVEEQLFNQISSARDKAEAARQTFIARKNESYLYYAGMLPGPTINDGAKSNFVERVLYNAVRNEKTKLIDSFTEDGSIAVNFRSRGFRKMPDVEELINYNLNKILLRENPGHKLLDNAFTDLCVIGDVFFKGYPEKKTHHESDEIADWVEVSEYLSSLADGWEIDLPKAFTNKSGKFKGFEWKTTEEDVTDPQTGETSKAEVIEIKGKIPLVKHESKIVPELLDGADLWVNTDYGDDFSKCRFISHQIKTTVGEAELMGFDPEKLAGADDSSTDDTELPSSFFSRALYENPTGGSAGTIERETSIDPKERPITLYHTEIFSSLPDGETARYQVYDNGKEILSYEKINHSYFVHGQYETIAGQFFGYSLFDTCKDYQDTLSIYHRINKNIGVSSAWRNYQLVKGQGDRESILNNIHRPGGVIEVMTDGAVMPLPPKELPQTFYNGWQAMTDSHDKTVPQPIGADITSSGIPQVATATFNMALFQDSQKGQAVLHNVEETLMKPLFALLYEIMREENHLLEGQDGEPVEGIKLPAQYDFIIDSHNTNDDIAQTMQAQSVGQFALQMSQFDSPYMNAQNKFEILKMMCDRFDLDSSKFLTDPSQNQDEIKQKEDAEDAFITSELKKVTLEIQKAKLHKEMAEVAEIEARTEELIKDAAAHRANSTTDSAAKLAKIQSDTATKTAETEVKNKQVNYDAMLHIHDKELEINHNRVNGIM